MKIIKKSDGTYAYSIEAGINPQTGKRKRLYKSGFTRKKDAEKAAIEAESARRHNVLVVPDKITFSQLAEEWLSIYKALGKKPTTIDLRLQMIKYWNRHLGAIHIQQITAKLYQKLILDSAHQYKKSSIVLLHNTARLIFKEARKRGLIYTDPTEFAVLPKEKEAIEEEKLPKYLEKPELIQFLETTKKYGSESDYVLFNLLAYTGLRIGEALALTWRDIDFKSSTICVNKTLYFPPGRSREQYYELTPPKTPQSRRIIDIDAQTLSLLASQRMRINMYRMNYGSEWHVPDYDPHGFVFVNLRRPGYPIRMNPILHKTKRIESKMDPRPKVHITPHVFRHTHTSLLAEAGVSLEQIQERLGHLNDRTTRAVYLHVTKNRKAEAAELFAKFMSK